MLENPRRSVLQDWVMELPLREQGTLLTAVRGCDSNPKELANPARRLTSALRNAFMVPADPREVDVVGAFFSSKIPTDIKLSAFDQFPFHWVTHILHAIEVVAYRHPDLDITSKWLNLYWKFCKGLHVNPESFNQFTDRMSEDRIASGEVVS